MWWVISLLFVIFIAVSSYSRAKQAGIWKWSKFALTLGFMALLCVFISVPVLVIPMSSRYFLPSMIVVWVVALVAIIWFAIYAKRWTRPGA